MNVPDPKRFTLNGSRPFVVRDNHSFKMIYHGTIAKRLGIDLAVKAVAVLKDRLPELEFYIWGKSGDEPLPLSSAGVFISVAAKPYNAIPPHHGLIACDLFHQFQDRKAILALLLILDSIQERFHALVIPLSFQLCHDMSPMIAGIQP